MMFQYDGPRFPEAVLLAAEECGVTFGAEGERLLAAQAQSLHLARTEDGILLQYGSLSQLCRGLSLLAQEFMPSGQKLARPLCEKPLFPQLGVMIDASRGAVPRVETLKAVFRRMALMGYNEVMLYTEDTYLIPEQPWFGYMRGAYTKEQLRELDQYASELGIELIPCIQTLAHLDRFLHWPAVKGIYLDCNDILLADSPQNDTLLEQMFHTLRECFSSGRIHVGMDEAMGLGTGRHLKEHGFEPPADIMRRHVDKVCALAKSYGFAPMMWSDMYFRLLSAENDYYNVEELPPEVASGIPQEMQLVYWDYYHEGAEFYKKNLSLHKKLKPDSSFAGGGWSWLSPAVDYDLFFARSLPALDACRDTGIQEVWLTLWGDDGAEADLWACLPAMQTYAEYCFSGRFDEAALRARFSICAGQDAAPLLGLSRFQRTAAVRPGVCEVNGAKFLLYQDPLLGLFDTDIPDWGFAAQYAALEAEYAKALRSASGPYCLLLEFYTALARALARKAELGVEIRRAYLAEDGARLRKLAEHDIPAAAAAMESLREVWRRLWMRDNHPAGFEVHDIRLGGVCARLTSARRRILSFCDGEIARIEELELEPLPYLSSTGMLKGCYFWQEAACASKL